MTTAVVVDDVESNAAYLANMLRRHGVDDVRTASNGAEALELVRSIDGGAPAVTVWLVDRHMPVMGGEELVRRLRSEHGYGGVCIGVTADSLPADLEAFAAAGLDDVVVKPVQWRTLLGVLARHGRIVCSSDNGGRTSSGSGGAGDVGGTGGGVK